ncbi:MAG: FKBP-type peptidyl-prolyl cis-trans isomerase [Dissulfurispiraceae bacterium]
MRLLIATVLGIGLLAGQVHAEEKNVLQTQKDKLSYSLGVDMGNNFKRLSIDIDPDIFAVGLKDTFSGGKSLMTADEVRETIAAFQKDLMAKQAERARDLSEKNRKVGETFLAENKTKEGVITLPSGLQYKIIKEGSGATPKKTDTVTVDYRGTLIDGTEFDSSYARHQPAVFKLDQVIPGWKEALQLMKVGSKWQVFIPSKLAYGERGAGKDIGPNATLIFDIELLAIK